MTDPNANLQARLQTLLDHDVPGGLMPEEQLCLAVLRQAVIDYFGEDPIERYSAWEYFAHSPLYALTLRLFRLPPDLLPPGVNIDKGFRRSPMTTLKDSKDVDLEQLVISLSGSQLKVMLTMGNMLPLLPTSAGVIAQACNLNRGTVMAALEQMRMQNLVASESDGNTVVWLLPPHVRKLLQAVWGRKDSPHPDRAAGGSGSAAGGG
jgi:hypothetical protein